MCVAVMSIGAVLGTLQFESPSLLDYFLEHTHTCMHTHTHACTHTYIIYIIYINKNEYKVGLTEIKEV